MVSINDGMSGTEKETHNDNFDVYGRIECLPTGQRLFRAVPIFVFCQTALSL